MIVEIVGIGKDRLEALLDAFSRIASKPFVRKYVDREIISEEMVALVFPTEYELVTKNKKVIEMKKRIVIPSDPEKCEQMWMFEVEYN